MEGKLRPWPWSEGHLWLVGEGREGKSNSGNKSCGKQLSKIVCGAAQGKGSEYGPAGSLHSRTPATPFSGHRHPCTHAGDSHLGSHTVSGARVEFVGPIHENYKEISF